MKAALAVDVIERRVLTIRGHRVMLDAHLAENCMGLKPKLSFKP